MRRRPEAANVELRHALTKTEDARKEAHAANRAKTDFLAVMSHELRTPLNARVGYAELLHLGIGGPINADHRDKIIRIRRSAHHRLSLIDQVLDFERLTAGRDQVIP